MTHGAGAALAAERAVVAALGGGCQLPLGAIAVPAGGDLEMHGIVTSRGRRAESIRHAVARSTPVSPSKSAARLADALARDGARELLSE